MTIIFLKIMHSEDINQLLKKYLNDPKLIIKASFSGELKNTVNEWKKITLRPIVIKGDEMIQFTYFDARKCITKNFNDGAYSSEIALLEKLRFKNTHIETTFGILQVQVSKKGKTLLHEEKKEAEKDLNLQRHNRTKNYILRDEIPSDFLEAVGIMNHEGKVKADKQDKFRQINGFLKIIAESLNDLGSHSTLPDSKLLAVDCGCGNAYLTFAVYNYFNFIIDTPLTMIGIDISEELAQRNTEKIKSLQWDTISFQKTKIIDFTPPHIPSIFLALHACNRATDEALYKAITCKSLMIFVSPCCHHDLQLQLKNNKNIKNVYSPIFHFGSLRERFIDILTDSFRALILRIMGYKTDMIEFVTSEHTNRNLLIKAIYTRNYSDRNLISEYKALKEEWQVTPYLETILGESFTKYLND